jgi:hypothetical protein
MEVSSDLIPDDDQSASPCSGRRIDPSPPRIIHPKPVKAVSGGFGAFTDTVIKIKATDCLPTETAAAATPEFGKIGSSFSAFASHYKPT